LTIFQLFDTLYIIIKKICFLYCISRGTCCTPYANITMVDTQKVFDEILDKISSLYRHLVVLEQTVKQRKQLIASLLAREMPVGVQQPDPESNLRREVDTLRSTVTRYRQNSGKREIGIAVVQEGSIKYANPEFADLVGYSREELLQWQPGEFRKIIHPDDIDEATDPRRRDAYEIDGITYFTYRIINKDKKVLRIHRYSKPIFFEDAHAHLIAAIGDPDEVKGVSASNISPMNADETYRILFDTNPYPALLVDYHSFSIVEVNNAAVRQYGYSAEVFTQMSVRDLYPEEELSHFLEKLKKLPLTLQMEVSTKHIKSNADIIDVEVAAKYLRLSGRTAMLMVVRDVTNKRWAETVVRESEMNYRNIFNSVDCMLFVIDRDVRILDLNTATTKLLHIQREDTIGRDINVINAGEKNPFNMFQEHLDRAFQSGSERFEWYIKRADGSTMLSEVILSRSEYFGHTIVVAEIRQKDDEAEPAITPDDLSETLLPAPTAIAIADNDGIFRWATQAFIGLTGYTGEELIGKPITALKTGYHDEERVRRMTETIQKGKVWSDEVELQKPDGSKNKIGLTITPVTTGDKPISHYVLTAKDIAREKEFMQQMLQQQKMESIDTISRAIAHNFNNILGIILGYTSFLEKRKDDPGKFRDDIQEIKTAVQRGSKLIKQMLAYTHRHDVSYETVDVNEVVGDVVNLFDNTLPDTIELHPDCEDDLPHIFMSRHQFHQIITELCVNARDAIENNALPEPGHGKILIETRSRSGSDIRELFPAAQVELYVELRVTDTGIGMDEDTKNKAFDPFFSAKEFGEGEGLGLTAVYGIVKSYDGFIYIESEPQKGSTFIVYLPVISDAIKHADTDDIEIDKPVAEPAVKGKTILIVEDEESLLQLLKDLLEEEEFRVITARDGIEAVKKYEEHQDEIALVLSDVGLPKLDGINAFLQMRRINPKIQGILASGYPEKKVKDDLHKVGIKHFIQKPYHAEEIISKVSELLRAEE